LSRSLEKVLACPFLEVFPRPVFGGCGYRLWRFGRTERRSWTTLGGGIIREEGGEWAAAARVVITDVLR
jgi:hypothetical protein